MGNISWGTTSTPPSRVKDQCFNATFLRHAFSWVLFNSGMSNSFYIVGHFEKEVQFQQYISFFVLFVLHDKEIDFFFFSSLCRLSCNHKLEDLLFKKKNHKFLSL